MKMMRVHATVWVVLLIAGFLLGFVPEYQKNRELQAQLQNPQKTIDALKLQVQMGELRDDASLMLLELSRQNYGLARDYSAKYYRKLMDAADTVQDPALKKSLQELVNMHDSLTIDLAAANSTSLTASQPMVSRIFEVTKNVQ
jgi:hypothetical protein